MIIFYLAIKLQAFRRGASVQLCECTHWCRPAKSILHSISSSLYHANRHGTNKDEHRNTARVTLTTG
jgi:hypothetical protein